MRRDYVQCPDFQINKVSSPLILLPYLNIPHPSDAPFSEFAVRYVKGDLSQGVAGFPSVVWKWNAGDITRHALSQLIAFAGAYATGSALVYIRTLTNRFDDKAWQNFSAQMYFPDLTGKDGARVTQWIDAYTNVSIQFAGLVAL
jgi:hypothetical protein